MECIHPVVVFLGDQEDGSGGKMALYNCLHCHSTITKPEESIMMQNVELKIAGDKLVIEIDLSKDFGLSKSGKTHTVASTGGFVQVEGKPGISLNLNVCRK